MEPIEQRVDAFLDLDIQIPAARGAVGVIAPTKAALQEVICGLTRHKAGVSRAMATAGREQARTADVDIMETCLQSLQRDPATEIVILVSQKLPVEDAGRILDRVRAMDKPTVGCFVGDAPRRAWRAGAIPATRLDEAAMRASAWIQGWDQALVSSWLEEEADELAVLAASFQHPVDPIRRKVYGILPCSVLAEEASVVLSAFSTLALPAPVLCIAPDPAARTESLRTALADPAAAVIVLDLMVDDTLDPVPAQELQHLILGHGEMERDGMGSRLHEPVIVAHVCPADCSPSRIGAQEVALRELGVLVTTSNAAAARLAGFIVAGTVGRPEPG